MRDRFPWLVLAAVALVLGAALFFSEVAARGSFAEVLSTYRSEPDGARALFLLAREAGLDVQRRHLDLETIEEKSGVLVLLGTEGEPARGDEESLKRAEHERAAEGLSPEETKALHKWVNEGGRLVYVSRGRTTQGGLLSYVKDDPLLTELGVEFTRVESPDIERQLLPGAPAAEVAGVSGLEARIDGNLARSSRPALPLLVDPHANDAAVALLFREGLGRVAVIASGDLASNRVLARAENAAFWVTLLGTMSGGGPVQFDEFHHGFTGNRSIAAWAQRYGLHWAALQLLLAFWVWTFALGRFGRPVPARRDVRTGKADYLLAMARIYRQGGHRGHVAQLLFAGLVRDLAKRAGLSPRANAEAVRVALASSGKAELAERLLSLEREISAGVPTGDARVLELARKVAELRRDADDRRERSQKAA